MQLLFSVSVTRLDAQKTKIVDHGPPERGRSSLQTQPSGRHLSCHFLGRIEHGHRHQLRRQAGDQPEISRRFMSADTDQKMIAFSGEFGCPGDLAFRSETSCLEYSIDSFQRMRHTLLKIRAVLERRDAAEIQNLFNRRLAEGNRKLEYRLEIMNGSLVPTLVVRTLFDFCRYEMLTAYLMNKSFGSCQECGGMVFGKRADARYCSDTCRVRAHYHAKKARAA